jgi:molecular chaperone GrpE
VLAVTLGVCKQKIVVIGEDMPKADPKGQAHQDDIDDQVDVNDQAGASQPQQPDQSDQILDEAQVIEHITNLEQQVGELTQALQRERADVMNVRRQHEEQIGMLRRTVKAGVVVELLPVIDNFERALKHVPEELADNDFVKGVNGIVSQFEKTLSSMGVERIKTVGELFDPQLHEAISMEEGDGTVEVVCEELQPGYHLGDQVIRHAMVKVKMEPAK